MPTTPDKGDVELLDWRLDEPSIEAFGGALNRTAPGMIAVATLAGRYAKLDHIRQEIVVDKNALLQAILVYSNRSTFNAAVSLAVALNQLELRGPSTQVVSRESVDKLVDLFEKGFKIVSSESIRNELIPRAKTIAQLTVDRDKIDLRHLVMAMLYDSAGMSAFIGREVTPSNLQKLREAIVAPLMKSRERDEDINAWEKLVDESPVEAEAAQSGNVEQGQLRPVNERIKLQLGDPAQVDLLDRKPFADVLGDRINEVRALQESTPIASGLRAYIVHLHGPWGSGKSTILNFLRIRLENRETEQDVPEWLVVDFNAWKYQRLKPPWWYLMEQIQRAAVAGEKCTLRKLVLILRWVWLRFRLGTLYQLVSALAIWIGLMFGYAFLNEPNSGDDLLKTFLAFAGLLTAGFGISNLIKSAIAKPETVAKAQSELSEDPYSEVVHQFESLIAGIKKPIIVFIDDLDRCDAGYVVDLLENIQTMLRSAPITYLVAGDRAWITTAFSKRYVDFASNGQNFARPLGYLFLDKLFQLSVNMPSISGPIRQRFLNTILGAQKPLSIESTSLLKEVARKAEEIVKAKNSQEDLIAEIDKISGETTEKQAMRVAVARRFSQTDVIADTEHRLAPLASLLEANPRSMKNLVSAVALNQSRLVLEGRRFDLDHLARWTILELRWPLFAEWLSQVPERIEGLVTSTDGDDSADKMMARLLNSASVAAILGSHLDADVLRGLVA